MDIPEFIQYLKKIEIETFYCESIKEIANKIKQPEYKYLNEIIDIEYETSNKTFYFKKKDKIDPKYLKPTTITTNTNTTVTNTNTVTEPKKVEIKKNIKLKKVVNDYLAPDVKDDEFNFNIEIKGILKNDKIDEKIFNGLGSKFTGIKSTDYELYSDELGNTRLENIKFESITNDNITIFVKIKNFYLNENQKEAVDDLKNIKLEDENKNIYSIYELIDKINSNIDIIKDHQYCKNFIKTYNDETTGLIKQCNYNIETLKSQCENTIEEINNIKETLEEKNIEELKKGQIDKFNKIAGDYGSKDISKYAKLSDLVNKYNDAINDLGNRIKLFKEYKNYETTVGSNVNTLIKNIESKNITEITNFDSFKGEQQNDFFNKTNKENLDNKYVNYKTIFEAFVSNLKTKFNYAINNKKSEIDKNSLKNEDSKKIFDEINNCLNDYQNSYSNINNIEDIKLQNSYETIKNEINLKINDILTKQLKSIVGNSKNAIEKEIKDKFNDENIKNIVNIIVNIINNKKEELKIKFTLIKKNTENLKKEFSNKFTDIVNKYQVGVYNNVKFSDLRSEISENKNDIKLFITNNEVNYNENIKKVDMISVEFPNDYLESNVDKKEHEESEEKEEHNEDEEKDKDKNEVVNNTTTTNNNNNLEFNKEKCCNSGNKKNNTNKKTRCCRKNKI